MFNRENIDGTFKDLQKEGCIDKNTRLYFENDPLQPTFYSNVPNRVIIVNECFPIPEDKHIIKYSLLHEEGHFKSFKWMFYVKYMPIPIIVVSSLLIIGFVLISEFSFKDPIFFSIFIVILFIAFWGWLVRSFIRTEEIKADIYSSLCLKEKFHLKPTEILEKDRTFYKKIKPLQVKSREDLITLIKKIYLKCYQRYVSVHPSFAERIEIIRKEVEEKKECPYINFKF